jgi:hypothetical protein
MKPVLLEVPRKFETERLLISDYEEGDGNEFYQVIRSNYDYLREELTEINTLESSEDAEEYVRLKRIAWLSRERFVPKIVDKATARMIGQLWIEPKWDRMIF